MVKVRVLDPHDPLPEGPGKNLTVLRRFHEDEPARVLIELVLEHRPGVRETSVPTRSDGHPMPLREAIHAAQAVARQEGISMIHLIDRTAGPCERDILQHHGDHSVHMEELEDFDIEDGVSGSDMRDRRT